MDLEGEKLGYYFILFCFTVIIHTSHFYAIVDDKSNF